MLLLVGAWFFLHTGPGERYARKKIVAATKDLLPGNLEIGDLDLTGNTIRLTHVILRDPEGNVVARIERVEVTFSVLDLVKEDVDLTRVAIHQPELFLVLDDRGFNLI